MKLFVFIQHEEGKINSVSLEALQGAQEIAKKSGGRLCLYSAKIPGDGPRGRCGFHGGSGNTGPKTAAGKAKISAAQKLRWARYRIGQGKDQEGDVELVASSRK